MRAFVGSYLGRTDAGGVSFVKRESAIGPAASRFKRIGLLEPQTSEKLEVWVNDP